MATVIESNFDIVAVVEVMQKSGGHPGYDQLMSTLGSAWTGAVTNEPRPNTSSGSAEFYAVLFRTSRVRFCDGWTDLRYANDAADDFSREPAFACLASIRANGGPSFDFLLALYHARFAEGDITEIKDEVEHLDDVYAAMRTAQPGEKDLIILGDFNLGSSDLADTVNRPIRTVGSGSTLNGSGNLTANLYDHLVPSNAMDTSEQLGPEAVIDVRDVASSNKDFFKTVSDHLPIVAKFRITGDDD